MSIASHTPRRTSPLPDHQIGKKSGKIPARFRQEFRQRSGNDALIRQTGTRTQHSQNPLHKATQPTRQDLRQRSGKKSATIPAKNGNKIGHYPGHHSPLTSPAPNLRRQVSRRPAGRLQARFQPPAPTRRQHRQHRQQIGNKSGKESGNIPAKHQPPPLAQIMFSPSIDTKPGMTIK